MPVVVAPSQYAQPGDLAKVGALPSFVQSLTSDQITEALQTASALMDSYFIARFTLPIQTWTYDVVQCCCVLAVYTLIAARGYNPNNPAELVYETRFNQQMRWLKDVANGVATPFMTDSSPNAAAGQASPTASPNTVSPTTGTPAQNTKWGTWARR